MPDLAAASASVFALGIGLTGLAATMIRYRVSILWSLGSGVDGNRISAFEIALVNRHRPERSMRLYLYLASRR
ncbi:hypothetical protein [Prosthecomicrobium sp. N25]|uniref:hypothetical protein n=1 Tax=Prosthecomicrobium sp. N25 TaxID=3129254 RepID=UPI003076D6B1